MRPALPDAPPRCPRSTRSIVQSLSQQKRQQSLLMDFLHVKPGTSGDAASKMHDLILKETRMAHYTDEQVEATFQKWEEFGKQVRKAWRGEEVF